MRYVSLCETALSACDAAATIRLTITRTEPNYHIVGFDDHVYPDVTITSRSRLDDAIREIRDLSHNGTNCSLPMHLAAAVPQGEAPSTTCSSWEDWLPQVLVVGPIDPLEMDAVDSDRIWTELERET